MEIRYYVCGLAYDKDDHILDYDREFGNFDTEDEAYECYITSVNEAEVDDMFFRDDEIEVAYWIIQLEKCEVTERTITCIDIIADTNIYKNEVKE